MINARDLKIGNMVYNHVTGADVILQAISETTLGGYNWNDPSNKIMGPVQQFQPIEFDALKLLLTGFPDDKSTLDLGGNFEVYAERKGNQLFLMAGHKVIIKRIMYFHQLQNIYNELVGSDLSLRSV